MTSLDYIYQNALRQTIVSSIFFFCKESFVRDTNLHYKDCSEMHSGGCSEMMSSCKSLQNLEGVNLCSRQLLPIIHIPHFLGVSQ